MKRILPALVCGFGAGVLNTVPIIKNFSCCLIVPVAAIFALMLDQRANGSQDHFVNSGKAIKMGLLTGLFAAIFATVFDLLVIFLTKQSDLAAGLPEIEQMVSRVAATDVSRDMLNLFYKMNDDIVNYGFSALYTFSMFMSSIVVDSIMGLVGGLFGMQVINNRIKRDM
ncbi:MAG: hypothetical protein Q8933_11770 [Bacteroidota bacterium]|nr:hypothetical protein [Bacteroidota bacterium]MDP4192750.1 hypothetical protein [Bacteroidota bacterium]MDP4195828.1 hypothetical protein [Bacteroidota bacterium]